MRSGDAPLPDVPVWFTGLCKVRVRTDEDGRYSADLDAPGEYRVQVAGHRHDRTIEADAQLDFDLPPGRVVGRITALGGAVVPGAVLLTPRGFTNPASDPMYHGPFDGVDLPYPWYTGFDGEGRFEFENVDAGTYVLRAFDHRGESVAIVSAVTVSGGGEQQVHAQLGPGARVRPRVFDPRGEAVPFARLDLVMEDGTCLPPRFGRWPRGEDESPDDLVAPGTYRVRARYEGRMGISEEFRAVAGDDVRIDVVLDGEGEDGLELRRTR